MTDLDTRGLLDTSVLIDLDRMVPTELPRESYLSAISLAELSVGPLVTASLPERVARQAVLQLAEAHFNALPFDSESARVFGRLAAQLRASGRKGRARTFDALIAATAIRYDLPLYTRNVGDFQGIVGVELRHVT
ncbi:MAG: type II toxin-antitoxin system VapC family toxin [Actinomycetales bacterium]